jgi:hypothetical protein
MSDHGPLAFVAGETPPALSISWKQPDYPDRDSGYIVFFSECDLDVPSEDWPESQPLCLHCLLDDGGEQVGRGLDRAKQFGQVDYDAETDEWYVPDDYEPAA